MKKYFEYEFNDLVKKKLISFYNKPSKMHGEHHKHKMKLKLNRALNNVTIKKSDVVYDIGCSEGELLKTLSPEIKLGIGLDLSKKLIENNVKTNKYSNIRYEVFDGINIKTNLLADKVFLLDVLEHAFEPNGLMKSICKILKQDGVLIIEVPTTGWVSEILFGKYHMGHLRYYDAKYLSRYLRNFGFKIQNVKTYNSVPFASYFIKFNSMYRLLNNICSIVPSNFYPYFGSIMVIAKKYK